VRWERLGRTYLAMQNYSAAGSYLHDSIREFRALEDTGGIVDALDSLTRLSLALGDRAAARDYGERLLKIYQARDQEKEAERLQKLLKKGNGAKG
jgi:tetratricopeptide (TPR) repeat protein